MMRCAWGQPPALHVFLVAASKCGAAATGRGRWQWDRRRRSAKTWDGKIDMPQLVGGLQQTAVTTSIYLGEGCFPFRFHHRILSRLGVFKHLNLIYRYGTFVPHFSANCQARVPAFHNSGKSPHILCIVVRYDGELREAPSLYNHPPYTFQYMTGFFSIYIWRGIFPLKYIDGLTEL